MDFPAWAPSQIDIPAGIADALRVPVKWTGRSDNNYLLALVADEREVSGLNPDIADVAKLPADVIIVTARRRPRASA